MGLLPEQFLEMRPCDWHARVKGYHRREEKQWEHTRLIVSTLTGQSPSSIIKLSSDKEHIIKAPSKQEQEDILKMWQHTLNP